MMHFMLSKSGASSTISIPYVIESLKRGFFIIVPSWKLLHQTWVHMLGRDVLIKGARWRIRTSDAVSVA